MKCKIISFRVADDEYLKVEALAKDSGFTSVSYFAREATLQGTSSERVRTPLDVQVERLGHHVEALTQSIEKAIAQLTARPDQQRSGE